MSTNPATDRIADTVGAEADVTQLVPTTHHDLLHAPLPAALTTLGANGGPRTTAIWYLLSGRSLIGSLTTDRYKYRNLVRDPRFSLLIIDPTSQFHTLGLRGHVRLVPDTGAFLPVDDGQADSSVVGDQPVLRRDIDAFARAYSADPAMFDGNDPQRYTVEFLVAAVTAT